MKPLPSIALFWVLVSGLFAKDPGMESIGSMSVELIYATNGDAEKAGESAKELSEAEIKALGEIEELKFASYRLLGSDQPSILRGYESWATPLRPSKELLVSFQPIKRNSEDKMQMVLEYWQSKRKVFSTNPVLTKGKTLYLLGPEWRKGRLILAVKILSLKKK